MSPAREEILARVRMALGDDRGRDAPVERTYSRRGTLSRAELADLLAERVAEYRASVHRVAPGEVRDATDAICAAHRVRRFGVPPGLPGEWRPSGVELVEDDGLSPHELDRLDGVLTGCTLAIAETGTLVLSAGARAGRRALTLVPDLHVCVVEAEQIIELVPEAIERLHQTVTQDRRPLTLVSGPSATSDIELSRVEGVHGPRRLEVVIVS
jgi:L-lactate dehydrogenase complex protein LldG